MGAHNLVRAERHRFAIVGVVMGAILLGSACGTASLDHSTEPVLRVATYPTGGVGMAALIHGTLAGTANGDGTACFYVVNGSYRTALIWPDVVSARPNPLRIIRVINGQRHLFATVGDHVSLGGGLAVPGTPVLGCGKPKEAWVANF